MKIFHKKFLNQEAITEDKQIPEQKSKVNYLLHQLLIWGSIFSIIYFITRFYILNV